MSAPWRGGTARSGGPRHVLVMAKAPVPGQVKTRLCPPCDFHEAAAVAEAALADTLAAVAACGADRRIVALAGAPGPWLPPGFEVVAQRGDGLDERLVHAWAGTARDGVPGRGIQIGMDTPQVTAARLDHLLATMDTVPDAAVLGHALDGGWWVIGLPGVEPGPVFAGVPMSTRRTGARQEQRLRSLGLDVVHAEVDRDIDTVADLLAVSSAAPWTRTAGLVAELALDERVA